VLVGREGSPDWGGSKLITRGITIKASLGECRTGVSTEVSTNYIDLRGDLSHT
jgi:hypothetical protein